MIHAYLLRLAALLGLLALASAARAQNVGIGTTAPDASAALDIVSSAKGVLLPRVASTGSVASPATGLIVYQTGSPAGYYYNAGTPAVPAWQQLLTVGSGAFIQNTTTQQAGSTFNISGDGTVGGTLVAANAIVTTALTGSGASIGIVGVGIRADGGLNLGEASGNIYLGYQAGRANGGTNNVFVGLQSGFYNLSGSGNVFSGSGSGYYNTAGNNNTFSGYNSGTSNTFGNNNTFSGYNSGANNSLGNNNTFSGYLSGQYNTDGSSNTALGYNSGPAQGSGVLTNATALGANVSLTQSNTLILGNGASVGIGTSAPSQELEVAGQVFSNTGGFRFPDNTVQTTAATTATGVAGTGYVQNQPATTQAGSYSLSGNGSLGGSLTAGSLVASGGTLKGGALVSNQAGSLSSYGANDAGLYFKVPGAVQLVTTGADRVLIDGAGKVGVGTTAPTALLDVAGSTRLRGLTTAGVVTTDASGNLSSTAASSLVGDNLGNHIATQNLNLGANALVGSGADIGKAVGVGVRTDGGLNLGQNTSGNNLFLGYQTGQANTTGNGNLFIGYRSGISNTTGVVNTFIGYASGIHNTSGQANVFNGYQSGAGNTTGSYNQFSGFQSGALNTVGQENTFSGYVSGSSNTTGNSNVFSGSFSGYSNTTGSNNVFSGKGSGINNSTGDNNTALGYNSGPAQGSGAITNATALGANVSLTQSNTLILGNGVNVGIGTSTPAVPLDIVGSQSFTSSGTYGYYAHNNSGQGYTATLDNVSVRASGRIVAVEFNASSDARLKRVLGFSDGARDLALLRQVRITDYQLRDSLRYGPRHFKKVIAQQVEQVFPQAVTQLPGFLPDIYSCAQLSGSPTDSLRLLALPTGLVGAGHAGQRLRLLTPRGEVVATLALAAPAGSRQLPVRGAGRLAGGEVFAFGFEHPDVRAVDYEALAMLGVSATQELARQLAALQAQNADLRQQWQQDHATQQTCLRQAAADHAALQTLQQQLARLLAEAPTAQAHP